MQKHAEMQNGHEMQMRCNVGAVKTTQEHRSAAAPAVPEGGLTGNQLAPLTGKKITVGILLIKRQNAWVCRLAPPVRALSGTCEISRLCKVPLFVSAPLRNKRGSLLKCQRALRAGGQLGWTWPGISRARRTPTVLGGQEDYKEAELPAHCLGDSAPPLYQSVSN